MYNTVVNDQAYVMKVTGRQEMHAILLFKRKTIVQAIHIWIQKIQLSFTNYHQHQYIIKA